MTASGIFVGYDYCVAFDGLEVIRCFNCNRFGHSSRLCKEKISCPKCSGEHNIATCTAENYKCVNCIRQGIKDNQNYLGEQNNTQADVKHAVWDYNCPVYKAALDKLKSDIFSA